LILTSYCSFEYLFDFRNVEKSRQRRSLPSPKRFAQAGRPFAVLTYWKYAPRAKQLLPPAGCNKQIAAFPSAWLRTGPGGLSFEKPQDRF
jgi:hypothetical protein